MAERWNVQPEVEVRSLMPAQCLFMQFPLLCLHLGVLFFTMVGMNIKILRTELGMTHDVFAKRIGVSARTLRRWESGERDPGIKYLKRIVDQYKVEDVYSFVFGQRPKEIPKLVYLD